ncbi:RNA-guided pseudouridylation complex pseudouridine synthase subunit Cbf5 [Candidatus Woesearchaeota archaeon]|nr:RNA-guided pseudouridylation complex pseudouridine synthase subunit Cbf5 [Candidatus Woesearchaeota archaeon]
MKLPFETIEREILVKKKASTDSKYGKRPEERTMQEMLDLGVICINKQEGPTSHQVADYVKRILEREKVGHGGTLDPHVTGVLPAALERATRSAEYLLLAGKEYVCLMHIHKPIPESQIHKTLQKFVGKITQLPPLRSAVKREERERNIYYIEILEIQGQDVLFKVGCQAGTYIRTLCHEFGKEVKIGAHMKQLVRTKAGPFNDQEWHSLHELKDAYGQYKQGDESHLRRIIKPVEFAVKHLPKVWVLDSTVDPLCHGANLSIPGISRLETKMQKNDIVAAYSLKDELIAVGTSSLTSEEMLKNDKGTAVKIEKVFMLPEVYPHYKKEITEKQAL